MPPLRSSIAHESASCHHVTATSCNKETQTDKELHNQRCTSRHKDTEAETWEKHRTTHCKHVLLRERNGVHNTARGMHAGTDGRQAPPAAMPVPAKGRGRLQPVLGRRLGIFPPSAARPRGGRHSTRTCFTAFGLGAGSSSSFASSVSLTHSGLYDGAFFTGKRRAFPFVLIPRMLSSRSPQAELPRENDESAEPGRQTLMRLGEDGQTTVRHISPDLPWMGLSAES
mmetsp:Transcript_9347/g.24117  ORF Transcript_9347/g.24117 Transcript_9347/m.24117 type:complete len:227 (+) Transcript_9347:31-711(+)